MHAHHAEATLTQNDTLTLSDLPFRAGDGVEVIILPRPTKPTLELRHALARNG